MSLDTSRDALPSLRNLRNVALPAAFVGLILLGVAALSLDHSAGHKAAWAGYLYGFMVWMGLTLGCATLTFLHHSIRAEWSLALLRLIEAGNKNLPLMGLFFLPLLWAVWSGQMYPWADHEYARHMHENKQIYLNPTAWSIRAAVYFTFWIGMTRFLNRSSLRQDEVRDESLAQTRTNWAAPSGVIHVVLITFAVTDWVMSLDPIWFSTLYGAWHMATQVLMTIAAGTLVVLALRHRKPFSDIVHPGLTKDLGNMMLAFTMVFGYFTLSQFLIIWSGNLPEEIPFYVNRFEGPMVYFGSFVIVGQFCVPFLALLAGKTKRTPHLLFLVALCVFVFRLLDAYWQIVPFLVNQTQGVSAPAVVASLGGLLLVGGVWLAAFTGNLLRYPLIAAHDPRLIESKQKWEASSHA